MAERDDIWFESFRFDGENACVWHHAERLHLSPKAFAVLQVLLADAGRLVTKEMLLDTVWPQTTVSDAAITVCIRELRQAFNDNSRHPTFIETVHRRGYRFVATLRHQSSLLAETGGGRGLSQPRLIVGRESELDRLRVMVADAVSGKRAVVLVTGEPGIGKTTLVDVLMAEMRALGQVWIARGQCVEHYGAGEPYRPVLEALGQLCRGPESEALVSMLRTIAPMWLAQMPWLHGPGELETLQQQLIEARPERMIRELVEVLELLTMQEQPLLLVLEDLHWGDAATLELLDVFARRRDPARLLIVGTYRINEVYDQRHPLRRLSQELLLHQHALELPLSCLSYAAVSQYLDERFPSHQLPDDLMVQLYQRTEGNPLFLVAVIEDVLVSEQGQLMVGQEAAEHAEMIDAILQSVPDNLQQMIEQKLAQLPVAEQAVLEAASAVGQIFTAAIVAAALDLQVEPVELELKRLGQRSLFLRSTGASVWPDGTVSEGYHFIHTLYREVVYGQVPAGQRLRFHQRVSLRLEQGYGAEVEQISSELAMHCELGWDFERAVHYRQLASRLAVRRQDYREGAAHLTHALALLEQWPDTPERLQSEFMIQHGLGTALMTIKGFSAPDVERALTRALELGQQVGASPRVCRVLVGLVNFYFVRGEFNQALEIAEQCLTLAQGLEAPDLVAGAWADMGKIISVQGEVAKAHTYLEEAMAFYTAEQASRSHPRNILGPEVVCRGYFALSLHVLGYPDQALQSARAFVDLVTNASTAFWVVIARHVVSILYQFRREAVLVRAEAEVIIAMAEAHGFQVYIALGKIQLGWALAELESSQEGLDLMQQGIAMYRATGAWQLVPYFLILLAEACAQVNEHRLSLTTLDDAMSVLEQTGERFYESELYRLKGMFLQQQPDDQDAEVERCYQQAVGIARRQNMRLLELRALNSWYAWTRPSGRGEVLREELLSLYRTFDEGTDTRDLQETTALLKDVFLA